MGSALCDFVAELVKGLRPLVRLVQQPTNLPQPTLSLLSVVIVLASLPLLQFIDLPVVELSHYGVLSDPDIDGFYEVAEYPGAEKEDVVTRRPGVIGVGPLALLEEDI